jgi:hypothetical protein
MTCYAGQHNGCSERKSLISVSLTPEVLYLQLGSLVAEMPDLANGPITPDLNRWLGRAITLVEATGDETATLKTAVQFLAIPSMRQFNAQAIAANVFAALAKAELKAPAAVQGTFIVAGHVFDAFAAVSRVLGTAKADVLMVDPYADEKVLTDYAVLAPEQVNVRLLTDQASYKKTLKPATGHWAQQFGSTRPLSVRLAAPRTLHDRAILVDRSTAWTLGQSFKDLVTRSHTTLVRLDPEPYTLKIAAYEQMWSAAPPL